MNELERCPFCGGEAEYHGECDMVSVRCATYDCQAEMITWFDEPEEAADVWNRRATGLTPERCAELARAEDGWMEEASDGTGYELSYTGDGFYCLLDPMGGVVCEFLHEAAEAALAERREENA